MKIDIYQIDAFANRAFAGNPAAVCPLDSWLPNGLMQSIAAENNLSETAFFVPEDTGYSIRWFTPVTEVNLCGHATLASAYVIFNILGFTGDTIRFASKSGNLPVTKNGDWLVLDFPSQPARPCEIPQKVIRAFGVTPIECLKNEDYIVIFDTAAQVKAIHPDMELIKTLDCRGVIISAAAQDYDFVARFFAPDFGVPEDPVTGSAYTRLAPYWATKLDKTKFKVKQVSARGGELLCDLKGDRVLISGKAVQYLAGVIDIPDP